MIQKTILDSIEETQTIFIEKDYFTIEYMPKKIKHRDSQIERIAYNIQDRLSQNKRPYHMVLNGTYGTGKTLTIKYIFKEVERKYPKVKAVHINCNTSKSSYQIYLRILEKLYNKGFNVSGLSTFDIWNKIIKKISLKNIILLVALDDIVSVKNNRDLNDVLYNLLRVSETDKRAKIAVFSVTNVDTFLFLDGAVQTAFNAIDINFPKYDLGQIQSIISERCKLGLYNGAIADEIIADVAKYAYDRDDLRSGLDRIYKAGLEAEFEGSSKILKRHFK